MELLLRSAARATAGAGSGRVCTLFSCTQTEESVFLLTWLPPEAAAGLGD